MRGAHAPGHGAHLADRTPDLRHATQVAQAVEHMGFDAVHTPAAPSGEGAWLTGMALARSTDRLKVVIALRPDAVPATVAAQTAATFRHDFPGRLALNTVTGDEAAEQAGLGDHLNKTAQRYARTDEWLTVLRNLWTRDPFDVAGSHHDAPAAAFCTPPNPHPCLYIDASSLEAGPVAARHAGTCLIQGESPGQVADKLSRIQSLAAAQGRTVRFGIRFHVVARDTSQQACAAAEQLVAGIDVQQMEQAQATLDTGRPAGQTRVRSLRSTYRRSGRPADSEVYPNVWAGTKLLQGDADTALVGSHREVATRIEEYAALGIEEFILSGFPHMEEAHQVGEGVLPLLDAETNR
ncbi:LLM class flavin-dependent oxidoreductase [Streptomyces sp. NRRL F-5053]|uniref:LLM class flavin-dependent oxidoreductase n=1 Tax=Streptomyces sp. NRRL F-5053 TaxID=1463854 RepID=UPI001F180B3B|nr:LLM class flavin-dependent oxidoreductase [Streptomyces sp. NRRL F-5053]